MRFKTHANSPTNTTTTYYHIDGNTIIIIPIIIFITIIIIFVKKTFEGISRSCYEPVFGFIFFFSVLLIFFPSPFSHFLFCIRVYS